MTEARRELGHRGLERVPAGWRRPKLWTPPPEKKPVGGGGLSFGGLPVMFGIPKIKVWHPLETKLRLKCGGCGCECAVALDGHLLHLPTARQSPVKKDLSEAEDHSLFCFACQRH